MQEIINQDITPPTFLSFAENAAASDPQMTHVVQRFIDICRRAGFREVTPHALRLWIVDMILHDFKPTTRKRYFAYIYKLFRQWQANAEATDSPFETVKSEVELPGGETSKIQANLEFLPRTISPLPHVTGYEFLLLFLYLFYDPTASLNDAIELTFDHNIADIAQLDDVIDKLRASSRKKYVFGLNQGKKRSGQIERETLKMLHSSLRINGMSFPGEFSRSSITALWIAQAIKIHVPLSDIRSLLPSLPPEYAFLSILPQQELSPARRLQILRYVANSVNNKSRQWFVMRLRKGSTATEVKNYINNNSKGQFADIEYFYPTHTLVREDTRTKKKKREEVPYLPGILFFRLRTNQVTPLFALIGHLAWCYRISNSPNSPYSTISRGEMRRFQSQIGLFSSDVQMELISTEAMSIGQQVTINGGGLFEGYDAEVLSVHEGEGNREYTLRLSADSFIRITTLRLPSALLTPH